MKNNKKLTRSSNRMIAGVCAGIAEYFGWDPTLLRINPGYVLHRFRRSNHLYYLMDCYAGKNAVGRIYRPHEQQITLKIKALPDFCQMTTNRARLISYGFFTKD